MRSAEKTGHHTAGFERQAAGIRWIIRPSGKCSTGNFRRHAPAVLRTRWSAMQLRRSVRCASRRRRKCTSRCGLRKGQSREQKEKTGKDKCPSAATWTHASLSLRLRGRHERSRRIFVNHHGRRFFLLHPYPTGRPIVDKSHMVQRKIRHIQKQCQHNHFRPGRFLFSVRIDEVTLGSGRKHRHMREYRAERNINACFCVNRPAAGVKNGPEIALTQFDIRKDD